MVNEFRLNNLKKNVKCKSPSTTDQWTMNWLYYTGRFGGYAATATLPWGTGPVLTAGKACITKDKHPGAVDLIQRDEEGYLLNRYTGKRAAVVHQFDRCSPWIDAFVQKMTIKLQK
jgi:hypothetical protein